MRSRSQPAKFLPKSSVQLPSGAGMISRMGISPTTRMGSSSWERSTPSGGSFSTGKDQLLSS